MSSDERGGGSVRRPRVIGRARVSPGPLAELKDLLYELYLQAGTPTLDQNASWIADDKHEDLAGAPARDTIARIIGDAGNAALAGRRTHGGHRAGPSRPLGSG